MYSESGAGFGVPVFFLGLIDFSLAFPPIAYFSFSLWLVAEERARHVPVPYVD